LINNIFRAPNSAFRSQSFFANDFAIEKKDFRSSRGATQKKLEIFV